MGYTRYTLPPGTGLVHWIPPPTWDRCDQLTPIINRPHLSQVSGCIQQTRHVPDRSGYPVYLHYPLCNFTILSMTPSVSQWSCVYFHDHVFIPRSCVHLHDTVRISLILCVSTPSCVHLHLPVCISKIMCESPQSCVYIHDTLCIFMILFMILGASPWSSVYIHDTVCIFKIVCPSLKSCTNLHNSWCTSIILCVFHLSCMSIHDPVQIPITLCVFP